MDKIIVTLSADQWQQLIGMTEQGTQVILAQLSMQKGALGQVAELSSIATSLLDEIRKQLKTEA